MAVALAAMRWPMLCCIGMVSGMMGIFLFGFMGLGGGGFLSFGVCMPVYHTIHPTPPRRRRGAGGGGRTRGREMLLTFFLLFLGGW